MAPTTHNENIFNRQAMRKKVPGRWAVGWFSAAQPDKYYYTCFRRCRRLRTEFRQTTPRD